MTRIQRFLIIACVLLACPQQVPAMRSGFQWKAESVSLTRHDRDSILVSLTVDVTEDAVARSRAVVLQPFVLVGEESLYLHPAAFYRLDGKGRRYKVRSDSEFASGTDAEKSFVCGVARGRITFDGLFPMPAGALTDSVFVYVSVEERRYPDRYEIAEVRKVAAFRRKHKPAFEPELYTIPVQEFDSQTVRQLTFPIEVEFEENRTAYNDSYGLNQKGTFELRNSLGSVLGHPGVKPVSVEFVGYSDIEGPLKTNQRNCQLRTKSLYDFVRSDGLFRNMKVNVRGVGEDWNTFTDWVKNSYWINEKTVSGIVFGTYGKDQKEARLRESVPLFWDNVSKLLFPLLNRYECTLKFTFVPPDNLADKWILYNSNRRLLSPKDYSDLIEDADRFSTKWYDLVFDFLDSYPDCHEACIDAAAAMLSLENYNSMGGLVRILEQNSDVDSRYFVALWNIYKGNIREGAAMLKELPSNHYIHSKALMMIEALIEWEDSPNQWVNVL